MKTLRFVCLLAGAIVPGAYSQGLLQSVPSFQPNPTICPIQPYNFSRVGVSAWKQVCGPQVMTQGAVTGTGTGACPTQYTMNSPCTDPSGAIAPTFTTWLPLNPVPTVIAGSWYISMTIGSATMWNNPLVYLCSAPTYSVPTSTTPLMTCPPPCPKNQSGCSPIVIDTTGEGFFLTSKQQGVEFEASLGSPLQQMSWTDPKHHTAFLVRPNADGSVSSIAGNMFGNLSPQPSSSEPNGYAALAYWAAQEGCGKISWLDSSCPAVWQQLKLWHDANQDGVAQPEELQTLEEAGVYGISLESHENAYIDEYGNRFEFEAKIKDSDGHEADRCYDVFLITE